MNPSAQASASIPVSTDGRAPMRFRLLLLLVALLPLTGCRIFLGQPFEPPPDLFTLPGAEALAQPPVLAEEFAAVFPPVERMTTSSRVTAKYRRLLGTTRFDLSLVADGPRQIRMRGSQPGVTTTIFDLVVQDAAMQVYLPLADVTFIGDVPPDGSPFEEQFGVEPWDVLPVVLIGQRIAEGGFVVADRRGGPRLEFPPDAPAGLQSVDLDEETGLPREARWRAGPEIVEVEYHEWTILEPEGPLADRWLLPSSFLIKRGDPYARIQIHARPNVRQYRVNPPLSDRTFELNVPAWTETRPLEDLDEALRLP